MILEVNLTQEDIENSKPGDCEMCILGTSMNRALKEQFPDVRAVLEARTNWDKADADEEEVMTHVEAWMWEDGEISRTAKFPKEVAAMADNWEFSKGDTWSYKFHKGVDIKPIKFSLEFKLNDVPAL